MDVDRKRHLSFPLRLPSSLKESANGLAQRDGVSLNHFISLAVAEKISRLEQVALVEMKVIEMRSGTHFVSSHK